MSEPGSAGRLRALAALAVLLAALAAGLALALTLDELGVDAAALAERLRQEREWGAALTVALMILHCFVPFPAEFLALAAGAVFGPVAGTALIWLGAMAGAALSFAIARRLGRPAAEMLLTERQRAALDRLGGDKGASALLIARLIPVIAFNLVNYAAGLTRVSWWTFLWTTAVGILPLTALMTWMGSAMRSVSWQWLLAVSAAGIAAVLIVRAARRGGNGA